MCGRTGGGAAEEELCRLTLPFPDGNDWFTSARAGPFFTTDTFFPAAAAFGLAFPLPLPLAFALDFDFEEPPALAFEGGGTLWVSPKLGAL